MAYLRPPLLFNSLVPHLGYLDIYLTFALLDRPWTDDYRLILYHILNASHSFICSYNSLLYGSSPKMKFAKELEQDLVPGETTSVTLR